MSRRRLILLSAVAIVLAWSPILWMFAPRIRSDLLREAGWSVPALRWLLIAYDALPYLLLYLIGCWLAWRVLRSSDSRFSWMAPLSAVVIASVALGDVGRFLFPAGVLKQAAYALWYSSVGPPELLLTAVVLLGAAEPYSGARLDKATLGRVRVYASFAMLVWLVPTPSTWSFVEGARQTVNWPVYLLQLSAARFLGEFDLPYDLAIVLVWMAAVYAFWYLVIRSVVAFRLAKHQPHDESDSMETVASVT